MKKLYRCLMAGDTLPRHTKHTNNVFQINVWKPSYENSELANVTLHRITTFVLDYRLLMKKSTINNCVLETAFQCITSPSFRFSIHLPWWPVYDVHRLFDTSLLQSKVYRFYRFCVREQRRQQINRQMPAFQPGRTLTNRKHFIVVNWYLPNIFSEKKIQLKYFCRHVT